MRTKVQNLTIGNNAGETTTATLVFMALHDMYGFSKKRMERLKNQCNKYNYESLANDPKFTGKAFAALRSRFEAMGISERLERDFINWTVSGLGLIGRDQREAATATIEACYVYLFLGLNELFKFGKQRLLKVQEKIKFYAGCIREGEPGIEEFMKCMAVECGQVYPGLIACEENYGEVKIYG